MIVLPLASLVRKKLRERGATHTPRGPRAATKADKAGLTPRQREVFDLMAGGLNNSEIAERLYLTKKTVEHHVSAILQKIGVDSRAQDRGGHQRWGCPPVNLGAPPMISAALPRTFGRWPEVPAEKGANMPRYMVERTFPGGLEIPTNADGANAMAGVVFNNANDGVTWITSYVTNDKLRTVCIYDGPTPEAIRKVAGINGLPVDSVTPVRVLDPYFYYGGGN